MKRLGQILILTSILSSCDPPHSIDFVNNSTSDLKVLMHIDTTKELNPFDFFNELRHDSIVLNIKPNDTVKLHFGIGTWSENEIDFISNSLLTVEFENQEFRTTYKTKEKIESLLKDNVEKGIGWNTKITIEIK